MIPIRPSNVLGLIPKLLKLYWNVTSVILINQMHRTNHKGGSKLNLNRLASGDNY